MATSPVVTENPAQAGRAAQAEGPNTRGRSRIGSTFLKTVNQALVVDHLESSYMIAPLVATAIATTAVVLGTVARRK